MDPDLTGIAGEKSLLSQTPAAPAPVRGLFQTPGLGTSLLGDRWTNVSESTAATREGTASRQQRWLPRQDFAAGEQPSPAQVRTRQESHVLKRRTGLDKLSKSMNILDEVVTPGTTPSSRLSMGVSSYTPGSLFKSSVLNRSHHMPSGPATPLPHAAMETPRLAPKTPINVMDETGAVRELLLETPSVSLMQSFDASRMEEDVSYLDYSKLRPASSSAAGNKLLEDPVEKTGEDLLWSFHKSFSSHHKPGEVLDLVESLQEICQNQLGELNELTDMTKSQLCDQLMLDLNLERSTWQLVHALYLDRADTQVLMEGGGEEEMEEWDRPPEEEEEDMVTELQPTKKSQKEVAADFFEKDNTVRQAQLVVDWLETNAQSNLTRFSEKIHYFADEVSWENTLHKLQTRDVQREERLVTEMDPDAPTRQGRNLADLDMKDEQSLIKHLFTCVRAGQLSQAQKLCTDCGQPWRAASLEGWRPAHDPNYGKSYADCDIDNAEGNQSRDLWRLACWEMAREPSYSLHERALYAALAGDLKNILPVCSSWPDYVWAYFKVLVDVKTEKKLRRCSPATGQPLEALPGEFWNSISTPELVFPEIEASSSEVIKKESQNYFHLTHKFIILGDLNSLVNTLHSWLEEKPHIDQLRFMAHMVLFVKGWGVLIEEDKCNDIMEAYVQALIAKGFYHAVAIYTAQLPPTLQVSCYADLLRGIDEPTEQRRCLDLGKQAGLQIATITKSVVEQIRNIGVDPSLEIPALELGGEVDITKVDMSKIEVIKWLVFEEAQRAEAIIQGNALMRQFLACRKLKAAEAVFGKLPTDSVEVVTRNWQSVEGDCPLSVRLTNALREYQSIQAYLEANNAFNYWFRHYHQDRPEAPVQPTHADFRGNAEYELKLKQFEADEANWQSELRYQSKNAEEKLYQVLLYEDGGWMVDIPESEAPVDEFRARQMRLLRETCIPQTCFLLLTVFNSTHQFSKSLKLADAVASERHQLYQLFRQHELEKFLSMVHESACNMVDDRKNELGYPI